MSRKYHFVVNAAGRLEMTGSVSDDQGRTTDYRVEPRRLVMESSDPKQWANYHRGDRVTIHQQFGDAEFIFEGVVLHKRLGRILVGEWLHPDREDAPDGGGAT